MLNNCSLDIGKRAVYALFLFFILNSAPISAETANSELLYDNRITGDLLIPTLGKTFDSQAFIRRSDETDLSSFDCSVTNTHNKIESAFLVDGESYLCGLRYERSINPRLRLHGSFNGVSTGGGLFDSAISNWHHFFGFPNGNRTGSENNQYQVQGASENGQEFKLKEEDFGVLDPQVYASYLLLTPETTSALYLNAGISIPLQLSQFSTKTPNFLLGLSYNKLFSKNFFTAGTDLTIRTDQSDLGINYAPITAGAFLGWTHSLTDSFAFVSNTTIQSTSIKDISGYADGVWYVDIGVRTNILFSTPIEILIRENLYASRSSADVSLILRVLKF